MQKIGDMILNPTIRKRDIYWGFLAQGLNIASGLLLLPMVLRYLLPEEVGLWFVFMSLAGMAQLLELGFQPTIARNVAYVYAGAQKLDAHGCVPGAAEQTAINVKLLQQLFWTARRIYLGVALVAMLALGIIGSVYISTLLTPKMQMFDIVSIWLIFSFSYVINFYYGYFNGFLQGRGDMTATNKIVIASRIVSILLASILLVLDFGLAGIAIASLISSLIGRFLTSRFFWYGAGAEMAGLRKDKSSAVNSLLPMLWPNASRLGWVSLGGFLITRANILIASSFLGLKEVASYGLTFQILLTVSGIAGVVLNLHMPRLSGDHARGRQDRIVESFGKSLASAWLIFIIASAALILFGGELLDLIGSHTHLLSTNLLVLFAVVMFLEMNHSLCAVYLTTYNEIPFVRAALLSGFGVVIVSIGLVAALHFGVWGLVLSQGVVQLAYNNWKWPKDAARKMQHTFIYVITNGFKALWHSRNV